MLSFLSRGARTFGLPTPLTRPIPPDVGHDSATVRKVPHFPAESCPTSQRNAAPLQTEPVPHSDGNRQANLAKEKKGKKKEEKCRRLQKTNYRMLVHGSHARNRKL